MATCVLDTTPYRRAAPVAVPAAWQGALIFTLPFLVYTWTAAATINPDGHAYFYVIAGSDWAAKCHPGHLLYAPSMTLLAGLVARVNPDVPLVNVLVLVDQLAAAGTVYLVARTAQLLGCTGAGRWLAACGLTSSYAFWVAATDVEVYGLTGLWVAGSLYALAGYHRSGSPGWVLGMALLTSLATLFHLATAPLCLAGVALLLVRQASWRHLGLYAAGMVLFTGGPILACGFGVAGRRDLADLLHWLTHWKEQYSAPFEALSLPRAAYGLGRSILFLDFFWEARASVLVVKGLVLVAAFAWGAWGLGATVRKWSPGARAVLGGSLPFALSQALLAAWHYGSEMERWVFLTPLLWLAVGLSVSHLAALQVRASFVAVAGLFTLNLVQGVAPLARDRGLEQKVWALARAAPPDAVLLTPGHDWAAYSHYYTGKALTRVALIDLASRHKRDHKAFYAELERRVEAAQAAGRPVILIRLLDPAETYRHTPWYELRGWGYTAPDLLAWCGRYTWREEVLGDPPGTRIYWLVE